MSDNLSGSYGQEWVSDDYQLPQLPQPLPSQHGRNVLPPPVQQQSGQVQAATSQAPGFERDTIKDLMAAMSATATFASAMDTADSFHTKGPSATNSSKQVAKLLQAAPTAPHIQSPMPAYTPSPFLTAVSSSLAPPITSISLSNTPQQAQSDTAVSTSSFINNPGSYVRGTAIKRFRSTNKEVISIPDDDKYPPRHNKKPPNWVRPPTTAGFAGGPRSFRQKAGHSSSPAPSSTSAVGLAGGMGPILPKDLVKFGKHTSQVR